MRVAPKIMLTTEEEKTLTRLSRSNTASVRVARRAQIVLLAAAGLDNKEIAAKLNVGRVQVGAGANATPKAGWRASSATCRVPGANPSRILPRLSG